VDWQKLESMLSSFGLNKHAAEAREFGRRSEQDRKSDQVQLKVLQQQGQELVRRARKAQQKANAEIKTVPGDAQVLDRAATLAYEDLPAGAQSFVDALVRQGKPGSLYALDGKGTSGVTYQCSALFHEDDAADERQVFLLIRTGGAAAKVNIIYRRHGVTWMRAGK